MTRKQLRQITLRIVSAWAGLILLAALLRIYHTTFGDRLYRTYRDMIPLLIAMPAAYLGYCFQQRIEFEKRLRTLWTTLLRGVQNARSYTYLEHPTQAEFVRAIEGLSGAIEEARAEYRNVLGNRNPKGWYPFEPIKQIHDEIVELGVSNANDSERRAKVRDSIWRKWKKTRREFLKELDPVEPTFHHASYARDETPEASQSSMPTLGD